MSLTSESQQTTSAADERLELRLSSDLKQMIEQASALAGQSPSDFILEILTLRIREMIEEADSREIALSPRDRDRFLTAIDDTEAEPNDALRRAADRYKNAGHLKSNG